MLDSYYLPDTKPVDQQIDEAYEDYLENFHEDGEPKTREEYEEYWLS